MPFMQRLTWDGIALHAGHVPAEPASHGCIRLPRVFARNLFGITALGTVVMVIDQAPARRKRRSISPPRWPSQSRAANSASGTASAIAR